MKRIVAVCLLLIAVRAGADQSPRFDYYLLALSLAPAFCEEHAPRKFAQCRMPTVSAAPPLTLHGLWPNRRAGRHPENCAGEVRGRFCNLPSPALPAATDARLRQAMPATADCLERHEWIRHGSCSGLDPERYFTAALDLGDRLNRALGSELKRSSGRDVNLLALRQAIAQNDPALLDAVVFSCRVPRTADPARRRPMLSEVRVYFSRDSEGMPSRPLDYRQAGAKGYNSGCPGGWAYVQPVPERAVRAY